MTDVVIVSGDNAHLVDALSAGPLATLRGAPVLLTQERALPAATAAEVKRLGATRAYVIGTVDVIGTAVETALRAAGVTTIVRLGGTDRYATAVAVSQEISPPGRALAMLVEEAGMVRDIQINVGKGRKKNAQVADVVLPATADVPTPVLTAGDTTAPTVPTNVQAANGVGQATVTWTASTDAVGVTGYRIYRNSTNSFSPPTTGTLAGTSVSSPFVDTVGAGTWYYRVAAYDAAGNTSDYSTVSNGAVVSSTTFTDGRDVTPTTVGLQVSEASLTSRAGGTFTSGTYEGYKFTSPLVINGAVTVRNCLIETVSGDTGDAAIQIVGNGTGRALFEFCEIRSPAGNNTDGYPSAMDRVCGVMGNQPFTFQYNYIHNARRFFYFASDGLGVGYERILQWNYIGDGTYTGPAVAGTHRSNIGSGVGSNARDVVIRGNNLHGPWEGNAISGCIQMYPEGLAGLIGATYSSGSTISISNILEPGFGYTMAQMIATNPNGSSIIYHVYNATNNTWVGSFTITGHTGTGSSGTLTGVSNVVGAPFAAGLYAIPDITEQRWLIEKNLITAGADYSFIWGGWTYPQEYPQRAITIQDNWFSTEYRDVWNSWQRWTQAGSPVGSSWNEPDNSNVWANNRSSPAGTVITAPGISDTTPPSNVTSAPTVSGPTGSTLNLSWTAATDNVGIAGYNIYRGTSTNPTTLVASTTGTGTTYTDTSLTAGVTYYYRIKARDGAGNLSANYSPNGSGTTTAATVPSQVTGVTATGGNASATVSWTAPFNGGSVITSYTVTPYIGASAQTTTVVSGSPPATSTVVTGLTNGTAYTFTVYATNAVGNGQISAASSSVTPTAVGTFTHGVEVNETNVGLVGAGVSEASLTLYTGGDITDNNRTFDRYKFTSGMAILGQNVTFTRCLFTANDPGAEAGAYTVGSGSTWWDPPPDSTWGAGTTFEDCEFRSSSWTETSSTCRRMVGIYAANATFRRCVLHYSESILRFHNYYDGNGNHLIEDCFLGNNRSNTGGHVTVISGQGNYLPIMIRRCRVEGPFYTHVDAISGAFGPYPETTPPPNHWTVDSCYIESDNVTMNGGYTINQNTPNNNWLIQNNYFGHRNTYGVTWNYVNANGNHIDLNGNVCSAGPPYCEGVAWTMKDPSHPAGLFGDLNNQWHNNVLYPEMTPVSSPDGLQV